MVWGRVILVWAAVLGLLVGVFVVPAASVVPEQLAGPVVDVVPQVDSSPGDVPVVGLAGSGFTPVSPVRVADTRPGFAPADGLGPRAGVVGPGESIELLVAGRAGLPVSGVGAVALNVTAVAPSANTFVTVSPAGSARPTASNLNPAAGQTVPNMVLVKVGAGGKVSLYNDRGATHLIVDLLGWFPVSSDFAALSPVRVADTRPGFAPPDGLGPRAGVVGPGESVDVQVTGRGGLPASGVGAVALNVTAVAPSANTFVTVFPAGSARPTASNLNPAAGRTVPNMVLVKVGAGGKISVYNDKGSTHLIVDLLGWFPPPPLTPTPPGAPTGLVVTAGDRQVSVAFTAPVDTGGAPISNYQYSVDGAKTWVTRAPASTVSPIVITGLTNGTEYSIALRAINTAGAGAASAIIRSTPTDPSPAGVAVSWGYTGYAGQIGNGSSSRPVPVLQPTAVDTTGVLRGKTIVQVGTGNDHACALTSDGAVACWGDNSYGQLGDGNGGESGDRSEVPVMVNTSGAFNGKKVASISAGYVETCAVTTDGVAACWGRGQNVAVALDSSGVLKGKKVAVISASRGSHSCAVTTDGVGVCWGNNNYGGLGDGTRSSSQVPVAVNTSAALRGKSLVQIGTGLGFSCALTSDGAVACWGYNGFGQLGDGSQAGDSLVPVMVSTAGPLKQKVSTISTGSAHTCALTANGAAYCWGSNVNGQLGAGDALADTGVFSFSSLPVAVNTSGALKDKTISQVSAIGDDWTGGQTCAVSSDGVAYCWGGRRLGYDLISKSNVPVAVDTSGELAGRKISQISAGSCALTTDRGVYCWDYLVYPLETTFLSPVPVDVSGVLKGKSVVAVSASPSLRVKGGRPTTHTCALSADGTAACWGDNYFGQLGDGTTTSSPVPVSVDMSGVLRGRKIASISAGFDHTCAVTTDGVIVCWGRNDHGRLGDGSQVNRSTPVQVDTSGALQGKKFARVSAGYEHTCAVTTDGLVSCWGSNSGKAIGDGTTDYSPRLKPVMVDASGELRGKQVVRVSSGDSGTCATTTDGGAYCWGGVVLGVKDGWGVSAGSSPVAMNTSGVLTGKRIADIDTNSLCAVTTDGIAACWTINDAGDLAVVPVDTSGVLKGRKVMAISGARWHTCAVTTDGVAACWGYNNYGALGNGTSSNSLVPVAVDTSGPLKGRKVTSISTGPTNTFAVATP